jgi:hypothetical protein
VTAARAAAAEAWGAAVRVAAKETAAGAWAAAAAAAAAAVEVAAAATAVEAAAEAQAEAEAVEKAVVEVTFAAAVATAVGLELAVEWCMEGARASRRPVDDPPADSEPLYTVAMHSPSRSDSDAGVPPSRRSPHCIQNTTVTPTNPTHHQRAPGVYHQDQNQTVSAGENETHLSTKSAETWSAAVHTEADADAAFTWMDTLVCTACANRRRWRRLAGASPTHPTPASTSTIPCIETAAGATCTSSATDCDTDSRNASSPVNSSNCAPSPHAGRRM